MSVIQPRFRLIAYYLPQFHPIPENDNWWGKGFTEWSYVAFAKPLFRGHYQPHIPADLGLYDLRLPETRSAQAEMARKYGIEGFCYWHYWFGEGKLLLERPFEEVLISREPDFPFCLGWANHSWTGIWSGDPNKRLIEQTYPGMDDHIDHFYYLINAFGDPRYITIERKPLFLLFRPYEIPDCKRVTDIWRELALKAGLKGLHLVGLDIKDQEKYGCDSVAFNYNRQIEFASPKNRLQNIYSQLLKRPLNIYFYEHAIPYFLDGSEVNSNVHPTVVPNWDSTPRLGLRGTVLHNSTPELFKSHVKTAFQMTRHKPYEQNVIFIKSWNEWAEGNHLEPDQKFGRAYLEVLHKEINQSKQS